MNNVSQGGNVPAPNLSNVSRDNKSFENDKKTSSSTKNFRDKVKTAKNTKNKVAASKSPKDKVAASKSPKDKASSKKENAKSKRHGSTSLSNKNKNTGNKAAINKGAVNSNNTNITKEKGGKSVSETTPVSNVSKVENAIKIISKYAHSITAKNGTLSARLDNRMPPELAGAKISIQKVNNTYKLTFSDFSNTLQSMKAEKFLEMNAGRIVASIQGSSTETAVSIMLDKHSIYKGVKKATHTHDNKDKNKGQEQKGK
ncbi:MAG: hypothetical protein KAH32_01515 [Chlamydiia bacterium]|nr:hypothetical protein [Chlamydiia bacterium]